MSEGLYQLLTDLATRCNIKSGKTLRKSKELIDLLNTKQILNCSETCKAVICLELASSLTSNPLNKEEAIKYSGCKKKNYMKIYNIISKLLKLDKVYTVRELCLLLGVSEIEEQATILFENYKKSCLEKHYDFNHPMYVCAAVLASCRASKVEVNTKKIVEISRIKKSELYELANKYNESLINEKSLCLNPKKKISDPSIKYTSTLVKVENPIPEKKKNNLMPDEEYQEWKKRMLED